MKLLQRGSKGEEVEALQRDLTLLGFTIKVDGIFGPNTLSGVEQLQWMFGYTVDGKVGDGTHSLIEAQKTRGWKADTREGIVAALTSQGKRSDQGALMGVELARTLGPGTEGSDVAYLQRRLRALGLSAPLSGEFDDATKSAVEELQREWEYTVDGLVGPVTHRLINAQLGYGWEHGQPRGTTNTPTATS